MAIKKGDNVIVLAGKDRGKKAKVLKTLPSLNRVLVEGVNIKKKHRKPRKSNEKGQIIEVASPVDVSNVALFCSSCGKGVRTGVKMDGDNLPAGKAGKTRVCATCKKVI